MSSSFACSTLFFNAVPQDVIERYEETADPANGYLTQLDDVLVLTDALAAETADWGRQTRLAVELTVDDGVALSIFLSDQCWALALANAGKPGPAVVSVPEDPRVLEALPRKLMTFEHTLLGTFAGMLDDEEVDALFGAMVEGAITPEDGLNELLTMLGVASDWLRWSWYEAIPEQLFIDPDLSDRVAPLGEARALWEE